ncbi:MAG: TraR/DksA family transcriptional regulator [Actinomycetota bacterium]|nr:TraR/DksA family transcriptional regulator [Actinomycetota bacterium]
MDPEFARGLLRSERNEAMHRLNDLGRSFDDIVDAALDSNGDDEHDVEGVSVAVIRAQVAGLMAADRSKIEQIEEAVRRLDAGTYGQCLRCGMAIPRDRLVARPFTPWCVGCAGA